MLAFTVLTTVLLGVLVYLFSSVAYYERNNQNRSMSKMMLMITVFIMIAIINLWVLYFKL